METISASTRGKLVDGIDNLGVSYYQTIVSSIFWNFWNFKDRNLTNIQQQTSGETLGNFYVQDNAILFKSGYVLKASTSSICQQSQEIYFLSNEKFSCIHESFTGAACDLSAEIDPSKIANNFILQKSKSIADDVLVSAISFVQKNSVTNQFETATLPGALSSLAGTTCTYPAVVKSITYIVQITESDITDIQAVVELASFE